ncbi:hypothetical protein [uncultured Methanobrevibacter sp.]|nr:hypothetical protein [uncultured Methanobrevibacter sp.]
MTNPKETHWTKECKNYPMQQFCAKRNQSRTIQDYGKSFQNQNAKKNGND